MTAPVPDTPTSCAYVVDDDAALRAELADTLAAAGLEVRTFPDGRAFLYEQAMLPEGCVVLDVNMPGLSGREVHHELRRTGSHHQIVMLTGAATVPLAVEALHAGAADFIEKPMRPATLRQAVMRALERLRQDQRARGRTAAAQRCLERLSDRERDVLAGLVLGLANKIIAYRLGLSTRTVETYRAHLMDKLEVSSLSDAVRLALEAGLEPKGAIVRADGPG